jgi:hypothetical protein
LPFYEDEAHFSQGFPKVVNPAVQKRRTAQQTLPETAQDRTLLKGELRCLSITGCRGEPSPSSLRLKQHRLRAIRVRTHIFGRARCRVEILLPAPQVQPVW